MAWLKTAWAWLRAHAWPIVVSLIAALGMGLLWQHHKRKLGSLKDLVEVEKAQREIAALKARREALLERAEEKQTEIVVIDERIAEHKRAIVAAHEEVDALDDDQIADAFARLGY